MILKEKDTQMLETSPSSSEEEEVIASKEEIQPCTSDLFKAIP